MPILVVDIVVHHAMVSVYTRANFRRHHGLLQAMFASSIPEIIELVGSRSKYSGELKREHGKRYQFDNMKRLTKVKAIQSAAVCNAPAVLGLNRPSSRRRFEIITYYNSLLSAVRCIVLSTRAHPPAPRTTAAASSSGNRVRGSATLLP